MLTAYQYASNNPIQNIDIDGLEGGDANTNVIAPAATGAAKVVTTTTKEVGKRILVNSAGALVEEAPWYLRMLPAAGAVFGTIALVFSSPGGEGKAELSDSWQQMHKEKYRQYQATKNPENLPVRPPKDDQEYITIYRGVSSKSDPQTMYAAAKQGFAVPKGFLTNTENPVNNPDEHVMGSNNSIFTSWSVFRYKALEFATDKGKNPGILLSKRVKASEVIESLYSNTYFEEDGEFLLPGVQKANPEPVNSNGKTPSND